MKARTGRRTGLAVLSFVAGSRGCLPGLLAGRHAGACACLLGRRGALLLLAAHMAAGACGLRFRRGEFVGIAAGVGGTPALTGNFTLTLWVHRGKAPTGTPVGIGHLHAPEKLQH